jgi:hypothetical protein
MEFPIFPLVMVAFCVAMMLLMMHGRGVLSSARMGCCGFGSGSRHEHVDWLPSQSWWTQRTTTGNQSFDDYRADTLRRLEEEQHDFQDFLARLRMAKDKSEFDQFMTERRTQP